MKLSINNAWLQLLECEMYQARRGNGKITSNEISTEKRTLKVLFPTLTESQRQILIRRLDLYINDDRVPKI